MELPFNMMAPRIKLADGEDVLESRPGLRREGLFGNRYGELYVTTQRVAFVKAIMKSGLISAAANKLGAKPMLAFERGTVSAEKLQIKKLMALVLTSGQGSTATSERFIMSEAAIDALLPLLAAR